MKRSFTTINFKPSTLNCKSLLWAIIFLIITIPVRADSDTDEGFLTQYLNRGIEKLFPTEKDSTKTALEEKVSFARDEWRWASPPKFGGYIVPQFNYTDYRTSPQGEHSPYGFSARYIRAYVSGTILRDFRYYVQVELKGTPGMRDYTLTWQHFRELSITVGQTDRFFTFESPMSLWKLPGWDYSQMVCALNGAEDYCGEPNQNARDQGLILQGDLLPVGSPDGRGFRSKRDLIHYVAAIYNGNGINKGDNNRGKDMVGSIQLQPLKGLWIGLFGWKGTYTNEGITVGRNRWSAGVNYEDNGWTARAEYAHNTGHRIQDYDAQTGQWSGTGRADAWCVAAGFPVTRWLKPFLVYDAYRNQATWSTLRSVYSLTTHIQLHKNLLFKLQYSFVDDRTSADRYHNELWAQAYLRF